MELQKASLHKNPFIGMFYKASDKLFLCPKETSEKFRELAEEMLKVKALELFIDESNLLGIFSALNSNGVVLPGFAGKQETSLLRKEGLNVCFIEDMTAIGNNILVNDNAAIVNPHFSKEQCKEMSDCLGVEVFSQNISNLTTVGAANAVTNNGLLAFNEISDSELKWMEKVLKVNGVRGTVNLGVQFVGMGVVANNTGVLVGELTTGFETQKVYEAFSNE